MKKLFGSGNKDKKKKTDKDNKDMSSSSHKVNAAFPDVSVRTVSHDGHAHNHEETSGGFVSMQAQAPTASVRNGEAKLSLHTPDVAIKSSEDGNNHHQHTRMSHAYGDSRSASAEVDVTLPTIPARQNLPVIKPAAKVSTSPTGWPVNNAGQSQDSAETSSGIRSTHSSLDSGSLKIRHASSDSEGFKIGHSDSDSEKGFRVGVGAKGSESHPSLNVGMSDGKKSPMEISISSKRRDSPNPTHNGVKLSNKVSLSSPSLIDDRPMSPTTRFLQLSRIDEKNSLVELNDRLAKILARNRQLEAENAHLNVQVQDADTKLTLISNQLSTSFKEENDELRKLLEASEKEKAKLGLQLSKCDTDLKEALRKLRKKEEELLALGKQISTLELRLTDITANLKRSDDDKGKLAKDKADLHEENLRLIMELKTLKEHMENEFMNKVELENQLRSKGDELQMKVQVHQQQFAELMHSRKAEVHEERGKLKEEYDARLADAIKQLRADCELQILANREEQGGLYLKKEDALRGQLDRMKWAMEGQTSELNSVQSKISALEKRISVLDGEKMLLVMSLKDMEAGWTADKAGFASEKASLEALIVAMRAEMETLINDYQGLMEIKVALDNEIATYRSLLEGEEERLDHLIRDNGEDRSYSESFSQQIEIRDLDFDDANNILKKEKRRQEFRI